MNRLTFRQRCITVENSNIRLHIYYSLSRLPHIWRLNKQRRMERLTGLAFLLLALPCAKGELLPFSSTQPGSTSCAFLTHEMLFCQLPPEYVNHDCFQNILCFHWASMLSYLVGKSSSPFYNSVMQVVNKSILKASLLFCTGFQ